MMELYKSFDFHPLHLSGAHQHNYNTESHEKDLIVRNVHRHRGSTW